MEHLAVWLLLITLFVASDLQTNITQWWPSVKSRHRTTHVRRILIILILLFHHICVKNVIICRRRNRIITTSLVRYLYTFYLTVCNFFFLSCRYRNSLRLKRSIVDIYYYILLRRFILFFIIGSHSSCRDRSTSTQEIGCVRGANSGVPYIIYTQFDWTKTKCPGYSRPGW